MNEGIREKDRDRYPILKKWHIRSNNVCSPHPYLFPSPSFLLLKYTDTFVPPKFSFTNKQYAHIRIASEYTKSEESITPLSDQTTQHKNPIQNAQNKGNPRYMRNSDGNECLFLIKIPLSFLVRERLIDRSSTL